MALNINIRRPLIPSFICSILSQVLHWRVGSQALASLKVQPRDEAETGGSEGRQGTMGWLHPSKTSLITVLLGTCGLQVLGFLGDSFWFGAPQDKPDMVTLLNKHHKPHKEETFQVVRDKSVVISVGRQYWVSGSQLFYSCVQQVYSIFVLRVTNWKVWNNWSEEVSFILFRFSFNCKRQERGLGPWSGR